MKVTIRPDGSWELDVQPGDEATFAALIKGTTVQPVEEPKFVESQRVSPHCLAALTKQQTEMYEALMQLDLPDGVHVAVLGVLLEKTPSAVGQMLMDMMKVGVVERVSRGYYRISSQVRDETHSPYPALRSV